MKPAEEAVQILKEVCEGALGTMEETGPFVSAAGFIHVPSSEEGIGKIYFLLSDLARHTRNLAEDPRAALLVVAQAGALPVHEKKRITLRGRVSIVEDPKGSEELRKKYLKIFPRAEIFFQLPDFRFYEFKVSEIHWIGGFGKAAVILIDS